MVRKNAGARRARSSSPDEPGASGPTSSLADAARLDLRRVITVAFTRFAAELGHMTKEAAMPRLFEACENASYNPQSGETVDAALGRMDAVIKDVLHAPAAADFLSSQVRSFVVPFAQRPPPAPRPAAKPSAKAAARQLEQQPPRGQQQQQQPPQQRGQQQQQQHQQRGQPRDQLQQQSQQHQQRVQQQHQQQQQQQHQRGQQQQQQQQQQRLGARAGVRSPGAADGLLPAPPAAGMDHGILAAPGAAVMPPPYGGAPVLGAPGMIPAAHWSMPSMPQPGGFYDAHAGLQSTMMPHAMQPAMPQRVLQDPRALVLAPVAPTVTEADVQRGVFERINQRCRGVWLDAATSRCILQFFDATHASGLLQAQPLLPSHPTAMLTPATVEDGRLAGNALAERVRVREAEFLAASEEAQPEALKQAKAAEADAATLRQEAELLAQLGDSGERAHEVSQRLQELDAIIAAARAADQQQHTYRSSSSNVDNLRALFYLSGFEAPWPDNKLLRLLQYLRVQPRHVWRQPGTGVVCVEAGTVGEVAELSMFLSHRQHTFAGLHFTRQKPDASKTDTSGAFQ